MWYPLVPGRLIQYQEIFCFFFLSITRMYEESNLPVCANCCLFVLCINDKILL